MYVENGRDYTLKCIVVTKKTYQIEIGWVFELPSKFVEVLGCGGGGTGYIVLYDYGS